MVDTVKFVAPMTEFPGSLPNPCDIVDRQTGEVVAVTDSLRHMSVNHAANGELRVMGSLSKYFYGSNVRTLKRHQVQEAITDLCDLLNLDPDTAIVRSLDLAATMLMPRPVAYYLQVLGSTRRFRRGVYEGETVLYKNSLRSITFYDKGKEAKIPGNLLRLELKLKKRLPKRFHKTVVLSDLYDRTFFPLLVDQWQCAYDEVRKVRRPVLIPASTPRVLGLKLAQIGVAALGGEDAVIALINGWPPTGKKKDPLRRKVRDLADEGSNTTDEELIAELDEAVQRAIAEVLNAGTLSGCLEKSGTDGSQVCELGDAVHEAPKGVLAG